LLGAESDPEIAAGMATYMKTDMAFYGVPSPARKLITRQLVSEFPATRRAEYTSAVRALWHGAHREEKYLAIAYARSFPRYVTRASVPMYHMMITQGAWWDFVDEIAAHLIGSVLRNQREAFTATVDTWSGSTDLWLRRTSIICQLRHKKDTDTALLDRVCTANLADSEFCIRTAVGWALREYAKTNADWVTGYVSSHEREMSSLSYREATKHLERG
jgi:3-methyladenine DNA glycosylase AlkD